VLFPIRDFRTSHSLPILTYGIIAINVLVFIYQYLILSSHAAPTPFYFGPELVNNGTDYFLFRYSVTPCEIFAQCAPDPASNLPIWITLFTSMFLHGDLMHLGTNMWFLWVFGDNVEDAMGKVNFLLFYILGGLAATLAQLLIDIGSFIPMVGASGAIAAVLGAYLVLYPHARVLTFVFIIFIFRLITLPAIILLGYWFLLQVFSSFAGIGTQLGGGVAYMAHIGGFIAGALLVRFFARELQPKGVDL